MIWLYLAKTYSFIYGVFKSTLNVNLRGLGFFLRKIKRDFIINVNGKKMYLNHNVASCYERLINGVYNEPETHIFFEMLMNKIDFNIVFIDVGANVGEMTLDFARHKKVTQVFGFEPHPECALACELSLRMNNYRNVVIISKALADKASHMKFTLNKKSPNASRISFDEKQECIDVESSTLDTEFPDRIGPAVILVDVEGGEPVVLRGGKAFIKENRPLIIFEYNKVSRKFFNLNEMRTILGTNYYIFRLRGDGYLDREFENTWNCVAVDADSPFYEAIKLLLV